MKTVIYDLDGTLVDTRAGILEGIQVSIHEVFPEKSIDLAPVKIGPPIEYNLRLLCPEADPAQMNRVIAHFRKYYDASGWKNSALYEGVLPLLERVKADGLVQYVVTNKPKAATCAIIDWFHLDSYFEKIICPDIQSPSFLSKKEMLSWLIETDRIDINEACYVGDTPSDASAAYQCGLKFGAARYGYGDFSDMAEGYPPITLERISDLVNRFEL